MYVPKQFAVTDETKLLSFARANNFATLVTRGATALSASHVPVLVDAVDGNWVVHGHVARANPQQLDGEALVIFSGPHAYVSPSWYVTPNLVPTWDYVAVHVSGTCTRIEEPAHVREIVDRLTAQHEAGLPHPWERALPVDLERKLLQGIVGFRVVSTDVRGSWKLHQHHSVENRRKVVAALRERGSEAERLIADLIEANLA